mmetsp:Transcript_2705/g.5875  ORF Transcript_2705/g.5875 Transcript_2705/m.5875 type:complete len:253 (+) Transcript_2705:764-1522(+)
MRLSICLEGVFSMGRGGLSSLLARRLFSRSFDSRLHGLSSVFGTPLVAQQRHERWWYRHTCRSWLLLRDRRVPTEEAPESLLPVRPIGSGGPGGDTGLPGERLPASNFGGVRGEAMSSQRGEGFKSYNFFLGCMALTQTWFRTKSCSLCSRVNSGFFMPCHGSLSSAPPRQRSAKADLKVKSKSFLQLAAVGEEGRTWHSRSFLISLPYFRKSDSRTTISRILGGRPEASTGALFELPFDCFRKGMCARCPW